VRGDRNTLTDWNESCAAHPFFTLVVTLRSAAYTLGLDRSAPEIVELRDRYLEPWQSLAARSVLIAALELAQRVGLVCRALTWHRVLTSLEEPFRSEQAEAATGWLGEFLEAEDWPSGSYRDTNCTSGYCAEGPASKDSAWPLR
jgi:hypothetical protein